MSQQKHIELRHKRIREITLWGLAVNLLLSVGKVLAGVFGASAAMIADGVHSLSDLLSDIIVLIFTRISSKGRDESHDFGHGKFETLAVFFMSLILVGVAFGLLKDGVEAIHNWYHGENIPVPGWIALVAAAVSVVSKEILYRLTYRVGKQVNSPATIANAWHHRSDALSSIGTLLAIGAAILLGDRWTVLDPIASCVIGVAIVVIAFRMAIPSIKDLLEVSLPSDMENRIIEVASSVAGVEDVHNLRTRRNGNVIILDAHLVVNPNMSVVEAHDISTTVEEVLKTEFGEGTLVSLHIEPSVNSK